MFLNLFALVLVAPSVPGLSNQQYRTFRYTRADYRRPDDCNLCYQGECFPFEQSRCDFYLESSILRPKSEEESEDYSNINLKNEVDHLMFDMVHKALLTSHHECIPYLSHYTDCHKENICLGCKTCTCTEHGKWNCTLTGHHCEVQGSDLVITHQVLLKTIDSLMDRTSSRYKRDATDDLYESIFNNNPSTQRPNFNWFNDMNFNKQPKHVDAPTTDRSTDGILLSDLLVDENDAKSQETFNFNDKTIRDNLDLESDIVFDDFLRSSSKYDQTKSDKPAIDKQPIPEDYTKITYVVDYVPDSKNVTELNMSQEAAKVVLDFLNMTATYEDFANTSNHHDLIKAGVLYDDVNDMLKYGGYGKKKRDANGIPILADFNNTYFKVVNMTNDHNETDLNKHDISLKINVLLPIIKLINRNSNELEDLKKIKDNLISFINAHNVIPSDEVINSLNINHTNTVYNDKDLLPDLVYNSTNPKLMRKIIFKVKTDIYEVIKDITKLQKFRNIHLPSDVKFLIHALRRYVNRNKSLRERKNRKNASQNSHFNLLNSRKQELTNRQILIKILQIIGKNQRNDALGPLTPVTKKIIRRVLSQYNKHSLTDLDVNNDVMNYNLTNELNSVSNQWQTDNIFGDNPMITHYRMELLYFFLEMDTKKITKALKYLVMADRRMMTYYNAKGTIIKINKALSSIEKKLHIITHYYAKKSNIDSKKFEDTEFKMTTGLSLYIAPTIAPATQAKISFVSQLRNILKLPSENNLNDLLQNNVRKSEFVKDLARKSLEELSGSRVNDYEDAMKRLLSFARQKRSLYNHKTIIIPKYLTYKLRTAQNQNMNVNAMKRKRDIEPSDP